MQNHLAWFKRGDDPALWFTVRCERCGEEVRIRVDRRQEARWEPAADGTDVLMVDKEILGSRCPNLMRLHLELDSGGQILAQRIERGQLVEPTPPRRGRLG